MKYLAKYYRNCYNCTTKLDQEIKVTYSCVLQMLLQTGILYVTEVLTFTKCSTGTLQVIMRAGISYTETSVEGITEPWRTCSKNFD